MNHKLILTFALCGAVLPLAIVGCGGGNGGLLSPNPTATPTANQPVALTPTTFTLQNGQRVTLSGTRTGDKLAGKIKVLNAAPQTRLATGAQNASFPFSVGVGEYGYTGTFTPPRGFNIVGNFGALGSFTMTGQLQTATEDGSYSITTNGVTDTGILPASGTPAPGVTNTPTPNTTNTPTPNTSGYTFTAPTPITFSNATMGSPILTTPIPSFVSKLEDKGTYRKVNNAAFSGTYEQISVTGTDSIIPPDQLNGGGMGTTRTLSVVVASVPNSQISNSQPFVKDQEISLVPVDFSTAVQLSQIKLNSTTFSTNVWRAVSGTAFIRAVGTDSATIELKDVRMSGVNVPAQVGGGTSVGEFTINGTLTATGLTVQNN